MKQPENKTDIRSLIGPINQFIRFILSLDATTEQFRSLMKKHSRFEKRVVHEKAFQQMTEIVDDFVQNHDFDVQKLTRVKCDASKQGLGTVLEQLHEDGWKAV